MNYRRVVTGRPTTATVTFTDEDGAPQDLTGSPTVVAVRDSTGATVTTAAVAHGATGVYTADIASDQLVLTDWITLTWSGTVGGKATSETSILEVVGRQLFSIADARKVDLADVVKYPDADIEVARAAAQDAIEEECGVAFAPRYRRQTIDGYGETRIGLDRPLLRSVRGLVSDGATIDVSTLNVSAHGLVQLAAGCWPDKLGSIKLAYEHGYTVPPGRIARAALKLARSWLIATPDMDRSVTVTNDYGTYTLYTPGLRGLVFDIPEVQAAVNQYQWVTVG